MWFGWLAIFPTPCDAVLFFRWNLFSLDVTCVCSYFLMGIYFRFFANLVSFEKTAAPEGIRRLSVPGACAVRVRRGACVASVGGRLTAAACALRLYMFVLSLCWVALNSASGFLQPVCTTKVHTQREMTSGRPVFFRRDARSRSYKETTIAKKKQKKKLRRIARIIPGPGPFRRHESRGTAAAARTSSDASLFFGEAVT